MKSNLGKILRLNEDGTAAVDNPFISKAGSLLKYGHWDTVTR